MYEEEPEDLDDALATDLTELRPPDRSGSSTPIGAHIVKWRALTDADARAAWILLRDWV